MLSDRIKGIALDYITEEGLWVATDNGMNLITGEDIDSLSIISFPSVFDLPPPHTINQLTDVVVDTLGNVWAGVYIDYLVNVGGVSFYNGTSWLTIDEDDGLVGPIVNQLSVDSENCVWVATTSGVSQICDQVSVIEKVEKKDFKIYPNPASGHLYIDFSKSQTSVQKLVVYNNQLQTIIVKSIDKGTTRVELDLENINSGLYFLQVGAGVEKLIIE